MAAFPSLPLFTDAWVADTKHLTRLERGTYHDLVVLMWRTPECRVPNDDAWLSKRLGMTLDEVKNELRPIIAEFCSTDGNWITQKRLRKEWEWCSRSRTHQSGRAKSRWSKEKPNAGDAQPGNAPYPTPPKDSLEGKPSREARPKRAKARTPIPDEWSPSDVDLTYASKRGFEPRQVGQMSAAFANHHRARGNLMADWPSAWRTWVENEIKFQRTRNGGSRDAPDRNSGQAGLELGYGGIAATLRRSSG